MTEKANAVPVFSVQQERHPRANDQHAERDIDGHIIIPVGTLQSELCGETGVVPREKADFD